MNLVYDTSRDVVGDVAGAAVAVYDKAGNVVNTVYTDAKSGVQFAGGLVSKTESDIAGLFKSPMLWIAVFVGIGGYLYVNQRR